MDFLEILKTNGIEVPKDKSEAVTKAVAENYKAAAALKALTESEDSKMLFCEPEPKPTGGKQDVGGRVPADGSQQATDTLTSALKAHYE